MARGVARPRRSEVAALPEWIRPQLTELVDAEPDGDQWLHEIKYDGYRMHARLDHGAVKLLTRTGLDWTHKYPAIARAVVSLGAHQAYCDGELCGVGPDGITSFNIVQLASDSGNAAALVFFLFDLLYLDGEDLRTGAALLIAYYDHDGWLVYAGRVGAGMNRAELKRLWRRLQPLATSEMPLEVPPPRNSRFGSPLVLSRVHWVRPELVAEVKYLTCTGDNLLRQVVYEGLQEDKPASGVRREVPHTKPGTPAASR
jgi:ATP-dependent DNA ligase